MPRKKPQPRRTRYSGSVVERSDGRVVVRSWIPAPTGELVRHDEYLPRTATRADGLARLHAINAARDAQTLRVFERQAVDDYLAEWLERTIIPRAKPKTVDNYRYALRRLAPLARFELRQLTRNHVLQLQRDLKAELAASSVVFILTVLKAALKAAVDDDLLYRSPMQGVVVGTGHAAEVTPMPPADARAMLDALTGHPLKVALELAVFRGVRSGEIRGLIWDAVDLADASLDIRHTLYLSRDRREATLVAPKTRLSRRWIPLSDHLVASLHARRAQQVADQLRSGGDWTNPLDLVITGRTGHYLHSSALLQLYQAACNRAQVPVRSVHALRHTANTIMANAGIDEQTRMAILGHANATINRRYTHTDQDRMRAAVEVLEDRIRNA